MEPLADQPLPTDAVGLLAGMVTTRAIRRYRDEPVPPDVLRAILFAATRAPSGSNRQPFRFVVLEDTAPARAAKALIAASAQRVWQAKRVSDGYDDGSGSTGTSAKSRMARTMQRHVEEFHRVPVLILPCLARYREPFPTEGASIYPACQNLLLAARALGYGGVLTGWHIAVEAELRALLGIPDDVFVAATITLGRPVGTQGPVRRRPLRELVYGDRWGEPVAWAIDPPGTRHAGGGPPPERSVRDVPPPLPPASAAVPHVSFDQGLPDPSLFPVDSMKRHLVAVLDSEGTDALKYFGGGHTEDMRYGHLGLREELARWIRARDGRAITADQVILVNGSSDGLSLVANACVGPGDGAVVEAATYPYARQFLARAGATIGAVPLDEHGMVVDELPAALRLLQEQGCRPKLVYTIPTFHAPTGTVLPLERRQALLAIAREWGVTVVEDNCYYPFGYDRDPPPTLLALDDSGVVVQSDSFSKYVAPGLRMAWLAGPAGTVDALSRARQDFGVSQLVARALARYLHAGELDTHLAVLRSAYRRKRDLTAAALRRHCAPWVRFREPEGGFYFWLELAREVDWDRAQTQLSEQGVAFRSGDEFVADARGTQFVRMSPIQVPDADIARGVAALGAALAGSIRDRGR